MQVVAPTTAQSIRNVLGQVLELAAEIGAKLIEHFGPGTVPLVIQDLRQRHPVQPSLGRDLLNGDATPLSELALLDLLGELEPDHVMTFELER